MNTELVMLLLGATLVVAPVALLAWLDRGGATAPPRLGAEPTRPP